MLYKILAQLTTHQNLKHLSSNLKTKSLCFAAITLLLSLVSICYQPALHGPFVFDDQVNILENPAVAIQDLSIASLKTSLFSNESGALKRIIPALSFGINYYYAKGFNNTFVFKITNLSIHLLNSLAVFCLMLQLAPKLFQKTTLNSTIILAFFITLLWATHPLQVSTVAYIVQRMTSMAAFFLLLGLNGYVWARDRLDQNKRFSLLFMLLSIVLGTSLGLLCKENAALLILYAACIEFCLFSQAGIKKNILWFYSITLGIPLCAALFVAISGHYNLSAGFYARPFTLEQRLLTETRALWFYVSMIVFPDIRVMGLFHDDFPLSKSLFDPLSTVISIILWLLTLAAVIIARRRYPILLFAVAWFLLGHSMESSFLPLEIIYEHRNYLPSLSLCILSVVALTHLATPLSKNTYLTITLPLLSVISLIFVGLTLQRATYWQSEANLFKSLATQHPNSPISLYSYAELLNKKQHQPTDAFQYYLKAVALNQDSASLKIQATLSAPSTVALEPLLNTQKLFNQLNKQTLTPFDLTVVNDAAQCLKNHQQPCISHLNDIRNWLNAAIDNPYVSQDWRRVFINHLFDIEMQYGLATAALATITKAQTQDPRVFKYYLQKTEALFANGQIPAAIELINTAEQLAQRYNPQLLESVYRIKNKITHARE